MSVRRDTSQPDQTARGFLLTTFPLHSPCLSPLSFLCLYFVVVVGGGGDVVCCVSLSLSLALPLIGHITGLGTVQLHICCAGPLGYHSLVLVYSDPSCS